MDRRAPREEGKGRRGEQSEETGLASPLVPPPSSVPLSSLPSLKLPLDITPIWRYIITAKTCCQPEFRQKMTLPALYQAAAATPSDINEHLPALYRLARQCRHVSELGTRRGN